ncbi:Putative TetR-family transcriptional regulator [Mycobacteroides abscessus subsp. abscessus]|nr:Putative TetR-family transcriptional regulator [Mycobacteroides abscessus subsp. abscessus]
MQAEYDRLYDATISLDMDQTLSGFERLRRTLLVYLHYQEEHPFAPVTVFRMIDSAARQRALNPELDVDWLADTSAHAMIDAVRRMPNIPQAVVDLMGAD